MQQSNSLYYYSSGGIFFKKNRDLPHEEYALKLFSKLFLIFAGNMSFHDRTETITTPIKTKTIPGMEFPKYKSIDSSFEELCATKARWFMKHAKESNRKLAIMYSGGIDSTLILVTFLKYCSEKDINDHIVVFMNYNSIIENKRFYEDFVIRKFNIKNSYFFRFYIGNPEYIFITGEGNDQLFGSQVLVDNIDHFSNKPWEVPINESLIIDFFNKRISSIDESEKIFHILNRICNASEIKVDNIYDWFWWINITCKWQSVYMRSASFTIKENQKNLGLFDNYFMFFSDPEFQLWSMKNKDLLIGDSFRQYKKICKDIIYDYNKYSDYRDYKMKVGSLFNILLKIPSAIMIDEHINFYETYQTGFLNEENDFMRV
jgi:hypothetical protein